MTAEYDGLIWDISDYPVGSSTPDEFYELSYPATTTCECGEQIEGVAQYWSRYPDSAMSWISHVDYEPCTCMDDDQDEDDEEELTEFFNNQNQ